MGKQIRMFQCPYSRRTKCDMSSGCSACRDFDPASVAGHDVLRHLLNLIGGRSPVERMNIAHAIHNAAERHLGRVGYVEAVREFYRQGRQL